PWGRGKVIDHSADEMGWAFQVLMRYGSGPACSQAESTRTQYGSVPPSASRARSSMMWWSSTTKTPSRHVSRCRSSPHRTGTVTEGMPCHHSPSVGSVTWVPLPVWSRAHRPPWLVAAASLCVCGHPPAVTPLECGAAERRYEIVSPPLPLERQARNSVSRGAYNVEHHHGTG